MSTYLIEVPEVNAKISLGKAKKGYSCPSLGTFCP